MMDINEIVQAVATLGFPIVACGALFWQNTRLTQMMQAEQEKTREALVNNTNAMTELKSALIK